MTAPYNTLVPLKEGHAAPGSRPPHSEETGQSDV